MDIYSAFQLTANLSRKISPVSKKDVVDEFGKKIKFILDGGQSKIGVESTIVSLINKPKILRLGGIERNKIKGSGISIILQDPLLSFNPVLTILRQMEDIVKYADVRIGISRGHEERKKLITETLRKVQLSDHERILNSYPIMLSGGMRQRVLIGMSLLNMWLNGILNI